MNSRKLVIGRADTIAFPEQALFNIPAKVDTGAKTSAIWATNIVEHNGGVSFTFFGPKSPLYTGEEVFVKHFSRVIIASSIGAEQLRYKVTLLMKLRSKRIRASFTLADRSQQAYPVLIGRNALRGKFLVDVQSGQPDRIAEHRRSKQLQHELDRE